MARVYILQLIVRHMTLFRAHGRARSNQPLKLKSIKLRKFDTPCQFDNTDPRETLPWYPVGWWRSWYDRVSRVPTYRTSPRAKLESDCVDGDGNTQ